MELSVAVVRYLLQQGYQPGQLVLLTPYLGQLLELQRELTSQNMQVRRLQACVHGWDGMGWDGMTRLGSVQ